MALPTTVLSQVQLRGYNPPHKAPNAATYAVTHYVNGATDHQIRVYKATDPVSGSWTEQDTSNRPTFSNVIYSVSCLSTALYGHIIHMAWARNDGLDTGLYEYNYFNTETDEWGMTVEEVIDPIGDNPAVTWCSIVPRHDGAIVVGYAGSITKVMGGPKERAMAAYKDQGLVAWTNEILLTGVNSTSEDRHWFQPVGVLSENAVDHIFWVYPMTGNTADPPTFSTSLQGRALEPDFTISGYTNSGSANDNFPLLPLTNPYVFNDGSSDVVFVYGQSLGTGVIAHYDTVVSENIGFTGFLDHDVTSTQIYVDSDDHNICSGVYEEANDTHHVLFSGGGTGEGADQDLYHAKSTDDWATTDGSPTEELNGVTVNEISAIIPLVWTLEETGHFDASDAGPTDSSGDWSNDANAFDNDDDEATSVSSTAPGDLTGEGTNLTHDPSSDYLTVVQVRIRARMVTGSATDLAYRVREDTAGTGTVLLDTTSEFWTGNGTTLDWSPWRVVAPPSGGWTTAKLQSIAIEYDFSTVTPQTFAAARAEIRVYSAVRDTKIAYLYDDAGDFKYNEIDLSTPASLPHQSAGRRIMNLMNI